jgi:hypothetical protein
MSFIYHLIQEEKEQDKEKKWGQMMEKGIDCNKYNFSLQMVITKAIIFFLKLYILVV